MQKTILALSLLGSVSTLSARELMCEECIPEPCCIEHLFVERSQIFFTGEFLYWTAEVPNLHYALRQGSPFTADLGTGNYERVDYDWKAGVRASITNYRCPRYWEVTAEYTWFEDKGSDTTHPFLRPTRELPLFTLPFESASGSVDLDYHVGDFYFARVFDPNPHLRLRLIGGATGAYIEQNFNISYIDVTGLMTKISETWRFYGGGLRAGLRADWYWCWCIYLTGKTTFATLAGRYKNFEKQKTLFPTVPIVDTKYTDHRFVYNVQFMLGPSFQLPCDCWSLEIFAGYESNIWFNLHERYRIDTNGPSDPIEVIFANGMLGVHGLTVRGTFGF